MQTPSPRQHGIPRKLRNSTKPNYNNTQNTCLSDQRVNFFLFLKPAKERDTSNFFWATKQKTDRQTDRQKAPNFKKYKVKYYTSLSQSYSSVSFSLAPPSEEVDTLEKKTPPEPALTPLRDSTTEIPSWRRADRQVRSGFTFVVPCLTALAMREDEEEGDERRRIWWRKSEISSGALAEVERSCWSWGWGAEVEDEQEDFLSYSYISPIITLQRDREREREKKLLMVMGYGLVSVFCFIGFVASVACLYRIKVM